MVRKMVESYYYLFDKKIKSSTMLVFIIALCITLVGSIVGPKQKTTLFLKKNIIDDITSYSPMDTGNRK